MHKQKEAAIISLHNEAETAKTMQDRIIEKNASGEYETVEAYFAELGKVPEIITKYDAVQLLFRNYSRVSTDKEHLVMLPSDAKGMTCGIEYILIIFICYISAVMCYYERKYKAVYISSTNAVKGSFCRLLALFSVIVLCWICFAVIELFSIITVIGAENLFVGVVSLQAFANTPFKESGILAVFIMIQLTKLCGYLLITQHFNKESSVICFRAFGYNLCVGISVYSRKRNILFSVFACSRFSLLYGRLLFY